MRTLVLLVVLMGCGTATSVTVVPGDAGTDAGMDAGHTLDSGVDAGTASADAGTEAVDAGTDAGIDAGAPAVDAGPQPLPYPTRTAYRIKGLQPDFWANKDEISGNNTGGVAMNLVWAVWEPNVKPAPCAASEEPYDGHCYTIDSNVDAAITEWSRRGLVVTAVVYGVPAWARITNCSPATAGFEIFCAPKNAADYGRFLGMLAHRYDGHQGHGRVADFVIDNEVNANDWFDVGCGQGTPCNTNAWVDTYALSYVAAFDAVKAEQPHAKVLISLEHHFGSSLDAPSAQNPVLSVQTFLTRFATKVGSRAWRVAYHPYPPNLLAAPFSPDDWPRVTYGNLGTLVGWLRMTFPNVPSSWEVQLTESGVNSIAPNSNQAAQAEGVCKSLRNALGTPGVESYIYHRMTDHPVEVAQGLGLGLRDENGNAKAAWSTWALANRNDLSPPQLACGFEDLPYTRLTRSYFASRGHWASSRVAPPGFVAEQSWKLFRDDTPGTRLLYECAAGTHNFLTTAVNCEGQRPLGPVGFIYTASHPNTVELFRCRVGAAGTDHFVSTSSSCEGQTLESSLGFALR